MDFHSAVASRRWVSHTEELGRLLLDLPTWFMFVVGLSYGCRCPLAVVYHRTNFGGGRCMMSCKERRCVSVVFLTVTIYMKAACKALSACSFVLSAIHSELICSPCTCRVCLLVFDQTALLPRSPR